MILLDIHVPAFNTTYNFSVDENIPIRDVIRHMTDLILQKEQCEPEGDPEELILCDLKKGIILSSKAALAEYGIQNGAELMLL